MTSTLLQHRLDHLLSLHPKVIDLSLGRVERLLAALGHPERHVPPVIHVAGTNGKGSTVACLQAILEAAGQRVHAYTSPHLVRFNERITLAGRFVDDATLMAALDRVEAANADAPITYFEITTAAAFLLFAETAADVLILETGLGGRLDATNVIARPALSVITPISFDHMDYLGDTLARIAIEKAGIIKPGCPVICAPQRPEARNVIARLALERDAPLYSAGLDWQVTPAAAGGGFVWQGEPWGEISCPPPALPGAHQIDNAGVAIAALAQLDGVTILPAAIAAGLQNVIWPARLQRLTAGPLVELLPEGAALWLDGSHNPGGAETLAATLAGWGQPVHLVTGMLGTKDNSGFLAPLLPHVASVRTVPVPRSPAGLPPERLAAAWQAHGIPATGCADVAEALRNLRQAGIGADETVLVTGSLYLAGAVLEANAWRWPGREQHA
jgi:dihydrofolate synthase/folylpolyglutamate synthase